MVRLETLIRLAVGRCSRSSVENPTFHTMILTFRAMKSLNTNVTHTKMFAQFLESIVVERKVLDYKDPGLLGDMAMCLRKIQSAVTFGGSSSLLLDNFSPGLVDQIVFQFLRQEIYAQNNKEDFIATLSFALRHAKSGKRARSIEEVTRLLSRWLQVLIVSQLSPNARMNLLNLLTHFLPFSVSEEQVQPGEGVFADFSHHLWNFYTLYFSVSSPVDYHEAVEYSGRCSVVAFVLLEARDEVVSNAALAELRKLLSPSEIHKLDTKYTGLLLCVFNVIEREYRKLPNVKAEMIVLSWGFVVHVARHDPMILVSRWAMLVGAILHAGFREKDPKEYEEVLLTIWKACLTEGNGQAAAMLFDKPILPMITEEECVKALTALTETLTIQFLRRLARGQGSQQCVKFFNGVLEKFPQQKPLVMKALASCVGQLLDFRSRQPLRRLKLLSSLTEEFKDHPSTDIIEKVVLLANATRSFEPSALQDALVFLSSFGTTESQVSSFKTILNFLISRRCDWAPRPMVVGLKFAMHHRLHSELTALLDCLEESKMAICASDFEISKMLHDARDTWHTDRGSRRVSMALSRSCLQGAMLKSDVRGKENFRFRPSRFFLVCTIAELGLPRDTVLKEIAAFVDQLTTSRLQSRQLAFIADKILACVGRVFLMREPERRQPSLERLSPLVRYVTNSILVHDQFKELHATLVSHLLEMTLRMIGEVDFSGSLLFCDRCIAALGAMPAPDVDMLQVVPPVAGDTTQVPPKTALQHFAMLHTNALRYGRHLSVDSRVLVTEAMVDVNWNVSDEHFSSLVSAVSSVDSVLAT